MQNDTSNMCNI